MCRVSTENKLSIKYGQMVFLNTNLPIPFNIICSFSTNDFIIGTIHKHQNFKKLTQQATTKQSLAKLIKNHKSYKTKRNISHNPYLKLALPTFKHPQEEIPISKCYSHPRD